MARTTPVNAGFTIINGTGTGSNGNRIDVWLEYQLGSQSPTGNYTPITVYFYAALGEGYTSSTQLSSGLNSALKVDGQTGSGVSNGAYDFTSTSAVNYLGSYTGNIAHGDDGTKQLSVTGSFTTKSTYISGGTVSGQIALPTIARASAIGATDASVGKISMIAVSTKSAAYTHSIAYRFGALQGYINADGQAVSAESKFSATAVAFTIPESFYTQLPAAVSGQCTLYCRTYSGSTQIGDTQTAAFTVTVTESACRPVVSGTVEDVNPVTLALTGDSKRLVYGYSTVRCVITAQAQNSASICWVRVAGLDMPDGVLEIPNVQTAQLEFKAMDSRGFSATDTDETVELIGYIPLSNLASAKRDDPVSGAATVNLSGSYWDGDFGAACNTLTVHYRLDGGEWVAVEDISISGGRYSGTVSLSDLDYTRSFSLEIKVCDQLAEHIKQLTIYKGYPVFEWGEGDFQFYVPVTAPALYGPLSGMYMRNARVWGGKTITLQTRYTALDSGGSRQSIFLFGSANGTAVYGLIIIHSNGGTQWSGTDGVQIGTMDAEGKIVVTLPGAAYDHFGLISAYTMEVI